jgi:hypothetical protein
VIAPIEAIAKNAELIRSADVLVVIDHYGLYGNHPSGQRARDPDRRDLSLSRVDETLRALSEAGPCYHHGLESVVRGASPDIRAAAGSVSLPAGSGTLPK